MDPGTTVGLAVLDLRGNLLHLSSKRGADDSWILSSLKNYGVPIIVATDVSPAPDRVKRLAAQFGAHLWEPSADLSMELKDEIAKKFAYRRSGPENDHERDALAAAYMAYLSFAPKFRQIEKRTGGNREKEEYVKRAVVFGQSMSRAIEEYERPKETRLPVTRVKGRKEDVAGLLKKISELRGLLREKEKMISQLKARISELEEEIERLKNLVRHLPSDEKYEKMRMERDDARRRLKEAQKRLKELEKIIEQIGSGELSVVRKGENLTGVVFETKNYAVISSETIRGTERDVIEKIVQLVEEYKEKRRMADF